MYKELIKTFLIILVVSFLMLVSIPLISNKIHFITLFSFIGYFYLTLFSFKFFGSRLSATAILIIIFVTAFLLQIYTIISWVIWDFFGLPVVITYCLGIISAFFYLNSKPPRNIILFSLSSCFVVFMFFQGWGFWLHKIDYGNFTGNIKAYTLPVKFEAFDEKKNLTTQQNFKNKIVLLDFWHTACGICFEKFPQVQNTYDNYKDDSSVMILAVNKPIEEDKPDQAFDVIRKKNYTFPVVITKDENLAEKLGVRVYPTTLVINENGKIVYRGDIAGAVKMVNELKTIN